MPSKITQEYVESSKHENDYLDQEPLRKIKRSRIISPIINVRTPRNAVQSPFNLTSSDMEEPS